jgi:hypothetical protein
MSETDVLSGIDITVKSSLKPVLQFKNLVGCGLLTYADVERIINRSTYSEDKSRLKRWIGEHYPNLLENEITYISGLKFKDFGRLSLKLLCGIEIATVPGLGVYDPENLLPDFEYCLIEHIDRPESTVGEDIFEYVKHFSCKTGIAHTDLISMARSKGYDPTEFLRKFAEADIFWEMNVNYDSIHGFNEHGYVRDFFENPETQKIVRDSRIKLTVGFDGHRVYDYAPERVRTMNEFIANNGFNVQEF